jgi:hypothetical protein
MDLNLRINIDLAKSTNYIPMGFWVKPVAGDPKKPFYRITDLGIPMVKVEDGSALGYSVYVLNVDVSDDVVPSGSNPQWRLIESAELIYIQQAFIERMWTQMLIAEGAEIGGFEIKDGLLQSKAKDANGNPFIVLNGNTGQAEIIGKFASGKTGNRIIIDPVAKKIQMISSNNQTVSELFFVDNSWAELSFYEYFEDNNIKRIVTISNNVGYSIREYIEGGGALTEIRYGVDGQITNRKLIDLTDAQADYLLVSGQWYRTGRIVKVVP